MIGEWQTFIESDAALTFGRVCRYFNVSPIHFLEEEIEDRYIQFCILEAVMYRVLLWEREQQEEAEKEAERNEKVRISQEQGPGKQDRVRPPTAEQIEAMLMKGKK